jgi:putative transcriptional regulator
MLPIGVSTSSRSPLAIVFSVRRSNDGDEKAYALPADPADAEEFDATAEALDRGQRARLIRTTRTALGLSQTEFTGRFRVPVGTLRDWEQARVSPPDFAVDYVKVIGQYPEMVAKAVA